MRGIGKGQTLSIYIIPEVKTLMDTMFSAQHCPGYVRKATPTPGDTDIVGKDQQVMVSKEIVKIAL